MNTRFLISIILLIALGSSCQKPDPYDGPQPADSSGVYQIPATYAFTNVNYRNESLLLNMLDNLVTDLKSTNTSGQVVSSVVLKNKYANISQPFGNAAFDTSGISVKAQVFSFDQVLFEQYLDSLSMASTSMLPGSEGVAGVVYSSDSLKSFLIDSRGQEWSAMIENGLIGAFLYYQLCEVFLSPALVGNGVDNTTVVPGEGTAMEHHWDQAFACFGAPIDFPSSLSGVRYLANYAQMRDDLLQCNKKIMNAFIKGRAAISNKDYAVRDEQVLVIKTELERVLVSTAISKLNTAKTNLSDHAIRCHELSEALFLIKALRYNGLKKISDSQLQVLLDLIGQNFYSITLDKIISARDLLSAIYGFDSIKSSL